MNFDFLNNMAVDSFSESVGSVFEQLSASYPLLSWLMAHPRLSVGIGLVVLVVIQALLGLIGRFVEQILIYVLQMPFKLVQWLLGMGLGSSHHKPKHLPSSRGPVLERLMTVMDGLETTRQELGELLQKLSAILVSMQKQENSEIDIPTTAGKTPLKDRKILRA